MRLQRPAGGSGRRHRTSAWRCRTVPSFRRTVLCGDIYCQDRSQIRLITIRYQVAERRCGTRSLSARTHPDLALGIPFTAFALIALTLTALAQMSGSDRFWFTSGVSDSYHVGGRYSVRSSQRSIDPAG